MRYTVELKNGNNTKYFSLQESTNDTANVAMESVLTNYALSVSDRIVMYKQTRQQTSDTEGNLAQRVMKFIFPNKDNQAQKLTKRFSLRGLFRKENGTEKYAKLEEETTDQIEPFTNAYLHRLEAEAELNESGLSPFPIYHFDRHFAASMVSTCSFMHSLLCQAYFRPYILKLVNVLVKEVKLMHVPDKWNQKRYGYVMSACVNQGIVPLGLLRRGKVWMSGEGSKFPYVYTNCKALDIVSSDDCLFFIDSSSEL